MPRVDEDEICDGCGEHEDECTCEEDDDDYFDEFHYEEEDED